MYNTSTKLLYVSQGSSLKSYFITVIIFFLSFNTFTESKETITIVGEVNQKVYSDILTAFDAGPSIYIDGYLAEKLPPKLEVRKIINDNGVFTVSFINTITKKMNSSYNFSGIGFSSHTLTAKYICPKLKCKLRFYKHSFIN